MAISSLYTAASALSAHQQYMAVVADNLANVDTVGFKGSRVLFADTLSQTLEAPGSQPSANSMQIGLGTALSGINPQFTQGALQSTGQSTDVAIQGNGFFVVTDPVSGATSYTRDGAFSFDSQGYLVTQAGQRVQGVAAGGKDGDPLTDLQVPATINGQSVVGVSIDQTGNITASLQDGTTAVVGQISLEQFNNPDALLKIGANSYEATPAAGQVFNAFHTAGTGGLGTMSAGYLENSNVDLGKEFANMITAERGLQANARVFTASDEITQEIINLKHS